MAEMLSRMKNLLIDVLLEKSLPDASKIKLKDCISMIEKFSSFFSKNSKKDRQVKSELPDALNKKLKTSRSTSDISTASWLNGEDDQVDINNLKENCLQAIKELNNNPEINADLDTKLNDIKSEVIFDESGNKSKCDKNSTKTVVINANNEQNHFKPDMNVVKPGLDVLKVGVNGTVQEVVKRDEKVPKPRRKRDSSTLFDISLDDITEPDHSGFLTEKHSGKEWWCVLQDQHLCMFPSQNPQELAYDVLLVPCCEISLDDVYTESPVFRLTQVGSTPWVFSAGIERNLRAWIRALYRACGRDDADWSLRSSKKGRGRKDKKQKRNMKVFTSTIDESEEVEETEEYVQEEEKEEAEQKRIEQVVVQKKKMGKKEPLKSGLECEAEKNVEEKVLAKAAELKDSLMDQHDEDSKSEIRKEKAKIEYSSEANEQRVASEAFQERERQEPPGDGNFSDEKYLGRQGCTNEDGNQTTFPTNISFTGDDDHSDYVITLQEAGKPDRRQSESSENPKTLSLERKATKKRIKMLRWLKNAFAVHLAKGQDDATVIGDIYKIESPDKLVKLWCLLRDRQLFCYHHVSDTTPVCKIPLDNCIAVPRTNVAGKKYAFDIEKEGVKLATFAAQTAKEQARWIDIVKNRRGTIRLREIADDSGEEAEGSSEEEDEGHGYVKVDDVTQTAIKFKATGEYVLPMSEDTECEDVGYVSVIALECEVDRRKSYKKQRKYNPNITTKCGIEHLTGKGTPSLLSTLPHESQGQCKNRSPAPPPRDSALFLGKPKTEISRGFPTILVDCGMVKKPGNETDGGLENSMDLNNNTDVEFLEKIASDDEELSSDDEGIFHCQMTASSWLPDSPPSQARFGTHSENKTGAWRPETSDKSQFLEIDIGDFMTVGAIGIKGRPDFDEKGGEFIKSFTVHYSIDKVTWVPYKSHGKVKVFQGISNANQECKKYFKSKTTAQYFRVYPQSWQNHIALQVALYKVDIGWNTLRKGGEKSTQASPTRKPLVKKKDISDPMNPSSDCLRTELTDPANFIENGRKFPNNIEPHDCLEKPATMESRVKLKEKLLMNEKREQITKLEVLTKHVDQAKDKLIVNTSGQLKREAIETEHDYLVANLELVKAKKRLIDIETEIRELRAFEEKYGNDKQNEQETHESQEASDAQTARESQAAREDEVSLEAQESPEAQEKQGGCEDHETQESNEVALPIVKPRPAKPLKRRPSKEVMVCTEAELPEVDPEGFNPAGDPPPTRKVLDNVKLFEKFQHQPR